MAITGSDVKISFHGVAILLFKQKQDYVEDMTESGVT